MTARPNPKDYRSDSIPADRLAVDDIMAHAAAEVITALRTSGQAGESSLASMRSGGGERNAPNPRISVNR